MRYEGICGQVVRKPETDSYRLNLDGEEGGFDFVGLASVGFEMPEPGERYVIDVISKRLFHPEGAPAIADKLMRTITCLDNMQGEERTVCRDLIAEIISGEDTE